jgi:hypothetical protein
VTDSNTTLYLSGHRKAMKNDVSEYYDNNYPDDDKTQPDNLNVYIFVNLKLEKNIVINDWFQV